MLTALVTRIVVFSMRRAWTVIAVSVLLTALSGWYAATHFAINTDIGKLIDVNAPWSKRDAELGNAFPLRERGIFAVIQAPAGEFADAAADELAAALAKQPRQFVAVTQPGSGPFFARHGLLFLDPPALARLTGQLVEARPLLNALARDPTLRGLADTLSVTLGLPLQMEQVRLADMAVLLGRSANTVEAVLSGKPAALSWTALVNPDDAGQLATRVISIGPVIDYADLQAGAAATRAIRATAGALKLEERYGASVRLTGPQPLADDEFASVQEGALINGIGTVLVVAAILWLALRSGKLIVAVLLSLFAGLAITAALGLAMVGALNMISVAFAVLFIGLGVDFGIQFGVRYRAERHREDRLEAALASAARALAVPLSLAAAATAAAFFCFLPTDYRGVAELGQIAGVGMVVAFTVTITMLPALIAVLRPIGDAQTPGFAWLAPADRFFDRHRIPVLVVTLAAILAASPLLLNVRFDSDPLNLKDPASESMATLRALRSTPFGNATDAVSALAPSLDIARQMAQRAAALPEVASATTLASFIPADQPPKLQSIGKAAEVLNPVLRQKPNTQATDTLRVASLQNAARQLALAADTYPGAGAGEARRLAGGLSQLAGSDPTTRDRADTAIALPLRIALARLGLALSPAPVTIDSLPRPLVAEWMTEDGKTLVTIAPRLPAVGPSPALSEHGVRADEGERARVAREEALARFVDAVEAAVPEAVGGPISIRGSADTILSAFLQAGAWAIVSIAILLWVTLRRFRDVLLTLIPLLVSAVVTLEICGAFGIALNFANVIALPLLLGIGVAFKIYYVIAWRSGQTHLLQSSLTHAVLFSAATTATAFGSLWLSRHPGTASMGQLLALSLLCTLVGAVFFQPVLMGRPRGQDPAHAGHGADHSS